MFGRIKVVYVVGSWNHRSDFIADRVYADKVSAVAYCESRANEKYAWAVLEMPLGGPWCDREEVHKTERVKCQPRC